MAEFFKEESGMKKRIIYLTDFEYEEVMRLLRRFRFEQMSKGNYLSFTMERREVTKCETDNNAYWNALIKRVEEMSDEEFEKLAEEETEKK